MSCPVLAFFNNKGGVGKTSLVYNLAWMLAENGRSVVACDLDPQANLTAAFLDEDALDDLMEQRTAEATTVFRCVEPLTKVGDVREPLLHELSPRLALLPGDIALSGFEDQLAAEWPKAMGSDQGHLYRPFRVLSVFWHLAQSAARQREASVILFDVGPNLGAINRTALLAADYVVMPLGADLFSLRGLRNLGPTLRTWRADWHKRLANWEQPDLPLPAGRMEPLGYVVQQHDVRLSRPVKAFDRWVNRIPATYRSSVLDDKEPVGLRTADDPHCLATLKHYRSLVPLSQEARKPVFKLTFADGALGSHALAVKGARDDYSELADKLLKAMAAADDARGREALPQE